MKAQLEKIEPAFGSSFTLRRFNNQHDNVKTHWHFHPEFEIVYISNGKGKRHIANHISFYEDGDLIFLGPNLPHFGFTENMTEEHLEIVLQMKPDFLGEQFLGRPEMIMIKQLLERSRQGIIYEKSVKAEVGERLKRMFELQPFERLMELLQVLQIMAKTDKYQVLNVDGFSLEVNSQHFDRMQSVYAYVGHKYREAVSLPEVAEEVNMTVPAFCRYFKRLTDKTFTQFVNEFRISHACRLLADESMSIAEVSFESGFNNLSHFNKQFRLVTGTSPREFRKSLTKMVD